MRSITPQPRQTWLLSAVAVALLSLCSNDVRARQQPTTAADYLPATTVAFLHVEQPQELISKIESHEVLRQVMELQQVKDLLNSPQFAMAMLGRGMLEAQIDEPVLESLKTNSANGIWLAVDSKTNGVILAIQSKDEAKLKRLAGSTLSMISNLAKRQGDDQPFKKTKYRHAVAAEFEGFVIARHNDWFLATNKPKLAQRFVDNQIDGAESPLSKQPWFVDATNSRKANPSDAWLAVDLESARKLVPENNRAFSGQTDNPGVELVFGGLLDVMKNSPFTTASLNLANDIEISVNAPFEADWANESRDYFFGKGLAGRAPTSLQPKNLVASLTSYRDVGEWWLSKEELYPENVIAQLAQADSQLSTIFSGMDFGEEVLGSLQPGVQIVATENKYEDEYVPDVKLPAFALVGKLKDKDKKTLQRRLRIAFQSVVGFANINNGMNGLPQLEVETEKVGNAKLSSAIYFYEEGTEEGLMTFNFAPAIAFQGEHIIISSTRDLAVELSELIESGPVKEQPGQTNTKLTLAGPMIHHMLDLNKESLIAQNMLEDGNDRQEAEATIGLVLDVVKMFDEFKIDFQTHDDRLTLDADLSFQNLPDKEKE